MEGSIVIQLYQYIPNYTAYRHLYGHLLLCGIASLTCAHANDLRDVFILRFFSMRLPPLENFSTLKHPLRKT